MIFLTTGEKIRSLRKKFGMRQQELEDENITRAFISMIENGKRGLSKETAKLIAEKLDRKAIANDIALHIDEAYLLRTPAEDAEIYCLQKLNNMPTQDEVEVIIDISKKFELVRVEALAFKFLGDFYYGNKDLTNAYINFMLSLDLYKNTEDKGSLAYLFNMLGLCKLKQEEFIEANSFFNRALHYAKLYNEEADEKIALCNLAKGYESLKEYLKAIEYIEKYLLVYENELSREDFVQGTIMLASCYYNIGSRERAYDIYEEILNNLKEDNNALKGLVYNNLGELYKQEGNMGKGLEYLNKAEEIRMLKDKKTLSCTLIAKANIYVKQYKYEEALMLCNKALKLSVEYQISDNIVSCYKLIIEIYTSLKNFSALKNTYIKLLEILKNEEGYKEEAFKLYNKLALLYLEQNDIEMCKKYLHMVS